MFVKSIRLKITILYVAILAVTLTSFSVILYQNVKRGLYENMDTLLKSKAGGITSAIDTYWETSKLEALEREEKVEILRKRRNIYFSKIAQRWVKEESSDPALLDIVVQLFDTDGKTIASSIGSVYLTEISKKQFLSVMQGRHRFDTVTSKDTSPRITFRTFTTPVFENEKVAYIVQIASPLSSIQTALVKIRIAMLILFPITIFATGMLGAFLAKMTLNPVARMTRTIKNITSKNMKTNLDVPKTHDEIEELAKTFNNMLGRLDESFASEIRFFEDLSHALKTPLTILKGGFEVILKRARSREEYESMIKSALDEINRINKLVEKLLLLSKFRSKEVLSEKKSLELSQLIQDIVNDIKILADTKNIRLTFGAKDRTYIYGDENQLKMLFLDMIENAVKYTSVGGRIDVYLKKEGKSAQVKIEDTGVGIPKEEIQHIFDRFYRSGKTDSSSIGFGLGLSIAKSIVEAHNGTIGVESLPSQGTIFTITLPAED